VELGNGFGHPREGLARARERGREEDVADDQGDVVLAHAVVVDVGLEALETRRASQETDATRRERQNSGLVDRMRIRRSREDGGVTALPAIFTRSRLLTALGRVGVPVVVGGERHAGGDLVRPEHPEHALGDELLSGRSAGVTLGGRRGCRRG
jgi:hypothetical protein